MASGVLRSWAAEARAFVVRKARSRNWLYSCSSSWWVRGSPAGRLAGLSFTPVASGATSRERHAFSGTTPIIGNLTTFGLRGERTKIAEHGEFSAAIV